MTKANTLLSRGVTLGKLNRDAKNMLRYARFVVVLKKEGRLAVIDNGDRRANGLPYAKIIAVLGPVQHKDVFLQESVLMEVGYSRTRPYAQLEKRPKDKAGNRAGCRWNLKPRIRMRGLSEEETVLVYPDIVKCMTAIVLEEREKWKKKGRWWGGSVGYVERGIHFTVNHCDKIIHRQMMLEDVRYRKKRYIAGHAKRIRRYLKRYKYSYYSRKELRSYAYARRIAELLSQPYYTPFYRTVICEVFAEGTHERTLLGLIMEAFGLDVSLDGIDAFVLSSTLVVLPELRDLWCHRPIKQPLVHAKGASTFVLFLERRYREKNEIPF
ncbi:MAG TPA: hypothetical protein ENI56_00010 [Candidatus Kaiserbacteria bacterium]|nr:hypothetical protein [Candidatus Kaiserbacteria bacterium]